MLRNRAEKKNFYACYHLTSASIPAGRSISAPHLHLRGRRIAGGTWHVECKTRDDRRAQRKRADVRLPTLHPWGARKQVSTMLVPLRRVRRTSPLSPHVALRLIVLQRGTGRGSEVPRGCVVRDGLVTGSECS